MDVGVCGGGVGGLAAARGLVADGHRVTVFERTDTPDPGGAAVTIFSNGTAAAAGLGVDVGDLGGDVRALRTRTADGRVLMSVDLEPMRRATGFGIRTVPRRDLVRRLAEGLDGVVRHASPVCAVRTAPDHATILLADGDERCCDVLVGADGHRSAVRAAVLGDPPTPTGWVTWQGLGAVLPSVADGVVGELVVGDAGLVGTMPAGDGRTQWWFDTRSSPGDADRWSAGPAAVLRERFGGYPDPVPALLDAISDADLGRYPHVRHRVRRQWGRGRVTLLGDAAHAFPPTLAQGANQTLEDAWLLRRALSALPAGGDPVRALRGYERRRADRVRIASRLAGTERTNRVPPPVLAALVRRVPAGWCGRAHLLLLRRLSSVLADEPGLVR